MGTRMQLILAAPPEDVTAAQAHGLTLAHMAYRVGGGPHLFRSNQPIPARGGLMYIDDGGFDGRGTPDAFCQEVVRECAARGFGGVICAFDRKLPLLSAVVEQLGPMLVRQGRSFYVSEPYGRCTATGRVLIPTALSGGSLRQRLGEAALAVFRTIGLSVYARADFIVTPDGTPYFLEINTLPGMTPTSLVPQEAAAVGIGYGALCQTIVEASLKARKGGA